MSNGSQGDFHFPVGKWIAWALVAIIALIAFIAVILILDDGNTTPEVPEGIEYMEWSIVLTDMNGFEVTLKGDEPVGFPTETWVDGLLLEREVQDTFEWDPALQLPVAVVDINDAADCAALNDQLVGWGAAVGQEPLEARKRQAQAFTQHAVNTMRLEGCDFDLDLDALGL